jgi:tRNA modification GTPase
MSTDTIAAVATPAGVGGVGIVRVSGPRAEQVLRRLCPGFAADAPSHTLIHVRAISPTSGALLDHVLAVFMRAPKSYTGEDVAELHGHGGVVNMGRLLTAVMEAGARPAEPGEFSKRAFLNGRLDLTQAEAVADIIEASSVASLDLAQANLQGNLGRRVQQIQTQLADALVLTESTLDFNQEEDLYSLDRVDLVGRVTSALDAVSTLLDTYDAGRQLREGLVVVIVGRPNVGKSSLFNALCGLDRAIVTAVPGTTRDFLEEPVQLDGVTLRLTDTAGIHETSDEVERIGIGRAMERARDADVVIWLHDGSDPSPVSDRELDTVAELRAEVIVAVNKSDLPSRMSAADLARLDAVSRWPRVATCLLGELDGALIVALREAVATRLRPASEGVAICRERHRLALIDARCALERSLAAVSAGLGEELVAIDLRDSLHAVGRVVGTQVSSEEVLNKIFSDFCVGK